MGNQFKIDVWIADHGSVVLLALRTPAATAWVEEHVADPQYYDRALVVEPRYLDNLVAGMRDAGLWVRS